MSFKFRAIYANDHDVIDKLLVEDENGNIPYPIDQSRPNLCYTISTGCDVSGVLASLAGDIQR